MTPFRLLDLPVFAIDAFLKELEIHERYHISRTSKKLWKFLRKFHACYDPRFDLFVSIREFYEIRVFRTNSKSSGFSDRRAPYTKYIRDYKNQLSYTSHLFNNPQANLYFDNKHPVLILDIMEHVEQLGLKIVKMNIRSSIPCDRLAQKILNKYRELAFLRLYCETSPVFQLTSEILFRVTNLELAHAKWVTRENLNLFHGCKKVRLTGVQLTPLDFVEFFRRWCLDSKIEYLEVSFRGNILDALEATTPTAVDRIRYNERILHFDPGQGYIIQKPGGIKGCVFLNRGCILLVARFEIVENPVR